MRRKPNSNRRIRQLQRVALLAALNRTAVNKRQSVAPLKTRTKMTMKKTQRRKALKVAKTSLQRATRTFLRRPG